MASSIYYPRTVSSSQELARNICPADMTSEEFEHKFLSANRLSAGSNSICPPNRPVAVPSSDRSDTVSIGPIQACTLEEQNTLAGAAVAQSSKVLGAINKYDLANKHYEDMKNHRAAPRMVNAAKLRTQAAFKEMNRILHAKSLNYLNNNTFRMRQTTNAAGRTVWESIPVRVTADVQKLARFAKIGRVAGPGFIVLDGYLRANDVYHSRKNNDPNWERKAVVQGVSFGGGIGMGMMIGAVIAITPVGLAIGIVVGGVAAVGMDYLIKDRVGKIYDQWSS